jgi:hypothetical protein
MFMSIYTRAARGFGFVQVNRDQAIATNHAIELAKHFSSR